MAVIQSCVHTIIFCDQRPLCESSKALGAINEVNMLPGVVGGPNQPIVPNQGLASQATLQCSEPRAMDAVHL